MELVIPGQPKPKQRPRQGKSGRFYTPLSTKAHERRIAWFARAKMLHPLTGPVALKAVFYRQSETACDVDNLLKALMDGLQGIAYENDSQVEHVEGIKRIDRKNPRTEVEIHERDLYEEREKEFIDRFMAERG